MVKDALHLHGKGRWYCFPKTNTDRANINLEYNLDVIDAHGSQVSDNNL